ncbi:hypothetical protein BDZ45DRAFT_637730 [Acephala macrosclerotiorum]|nr:hypothetical protein BDZ45DRAFT_637730 [Acephala macrosclerotiorum]
METSRYQLVDSLYGPGTVGAWLLTLCAVLISWTLNISTRCKDNISIDFVGALLLPLVSAGHLIFQASRLPYSVAETITSADVEVQKYASALEAPLTICEAFSMVALIAAACCGPWWDSDPKLRRLIAVLVTGLLSWGTENLMFAMATLRGVKASDATLSRPYLFLITPIVAMTWGFLTLCVLAGGLVWIIGRINIKRAQKSEADLEKTRKLWSRRYHSTVSNFGNGDTKITRHQMVKLNAAGLDVVRQDSRAVASMTLLTLFFLPMSFVSSVFGMSFSDTKQSMAAKPHRPFFLIPESNASMSNLDQILALTGGILVLLWAIRAAYSSRKNSAELLQSVLIRRRSI